MSTRMFTLPPCTAVAVCRLALVLAASVIAPTGSAAAQTAAMPDEQTVADVYTYLLGRPLVIRQEHIDLKETGIAYNVVKYNPLGSADFVNPNLDVAYLEAWCAVDDRTPVILDVPQVKDRYYFPADQLPGSVTTAGYWSIVLVSVPDYRVVPNPLKRYNFNNHSKLAQEADGSLKIAVGPEPVRGVPESNWLPAAAGKPFSLTWRTYVPKDLVKRGEWSPPPVTLAQ